MEIETLRREPTNTAIPAAGPATVLDYSTGALRIDRAKHHLDEALPNRQVKRAEAAFKELRAGVEELGVWMRSAGYDV